MTAFAYSAEETTSASILPTDLSGTVINNHRALTRGNTIYMKYLTPGSDDWFNTLVHEATHVWQCQNGGTDYISEALYAQIFGGGYDYFDEIKSRSKTWAMLNPEQQGQFVQDAYQFGYFNNPKQWNNPNRPNQSDRQFLIQAFDKALLQLRSGQGAT